jgi:hypothetical protein
MKNYLPIKRNEISMCFNINEPCRHRSPHTDVFHLYKTSWIDKSTDTGSSLVVVGAHVGRWSATATSTGYFGGMMEMLWNQIVVVAVQP